MLSARTGRRLAMGVAASSLSVIGTSGTGLAAGHTPGAAGHTSGPATATPIKHLVVIFQENVSFDDYFATCPKAANPAGEPAFHAAPRTPNVNGLNTPLLAPNNPNSVQPFRLGRDQAETSDQDHSYTDEQKAFDSGLLDKFVETVGRGTAACADYGKPRAPLSRRAPA